MIFSFTKNDTSKPEFSLKGCVITIPLDSVQPVLLLAELYHYAGLLSWKSRDTGSVLPALCAFRPSPRFIQSSMVVELSQIVFEIVVGVEAV